MKKMLLSVGLLFAFCFLGFGQVDTVAVSKKLDSLIQNSRALTNKQDFSKALEVNDLAEKLALGKLGAGSAAYGSVCFNYGRIYYMKADYQPAEMWYIKAKSIREKTIGKENPIYAQSLNNLALLYKAMGKFESAEPLFLETIAIRQKVLGKEHPDYAKSLINLGGLYAAMDKFEKSILLFLESKVIQE